MSEGLWPCMGSVVRVTSLRRWCCSALALVLWLRAGRPRPDARVAARRLGATPALALALLVGAAIAYQTWLYSSSRRTPGMR